MLGTILIILYVIACLFLILVVLLQAGKGGGLGALAGGGGSSSVFGGRGAATFLTKLTGFMAGMFMVLSVAISLNIRAGNDLAPEEVKVEEDEDLSKLKANIGEEVAPAEGATEAVPESTPATETAPAAEEKPASEAAPATGEKPAE